LRQDEIARRGCVVSAIDAFDLTRERGVVLVDLREEGERRRHGVIPGSLSAPYPALQDNIRPGGILRELAQSTGRRLLFYCAFGERSAMAVEAAHEAGIQAASHIEGGIDAWKKAGGTCDLRAD
jgi:rhodanese-related sulfurtransferase